MSTGDPLVSIITPAYNAGDHIAATIASVQAQGFANWELVIADDASTDDTCKVVERLANADPRIRLLRSERNLGAGPSRNRAIEAARGRYVAFLDSDDAWLPEKLERQLAFMQVTGAYFAFTAYAMMDKDGAPLGREIRAPATMAYRDLLQNTVIGCLTVMIDRKRAPALAMPAIPSRQPLVLWLRLLREHGPAHGLDEVLARYRVRAGSISSNKALAARQVWRVYREHEKLGLFTAMRCFCLYATRGLARNAGVRRL